MLSLEHEPKKQFLRKKNDAVFYSHPMARDSSENLETVEFDEK